MSDLTDRASWWQIFQISTSHTCPCQSCPNYVFQILKLSKKIMTPEIHGNIFSSSTLRCNWILGILIRQRVLWLWVSSKCSKSNFFILGIFEMFQTGFANILKCSGTYLLNSEYFQMGWHRSVKLWIFSVFSSAFKISRLRDFGCQVWLVNKTQFGSQAPINIIDKLVIIIIIIVVVIFLLLSSTS